MNYTEMEITSTQHCLMPRHLSCSSREVAPCPVHFAWNSPMSGATALIHDSLPRCPPRLLRLHSKLLRNSLLALHANPSSLSCELIFGFHLFVCSCQLVFCMRTRETWSWTPGTRKSILGFSWPSVEFRVQ